VGALAMPALAGLLMVVGFQTLKLDEVMQVWKTGNVQKVVMVSTFGATLLIPLQYAVMIGVILSTVLFVIRQSSKITIKEWVLDPESSYPVEKEPSKYLSSGQVTILRPYGSRFYAAASIFEEQLPKVTADTRFAVVIINLRGRTELGSTFLDVVERYALELRKKQGRLILAEVRSSVFKQLVKTGRIDEVGRENIYRRTARVAETVVRAYEDAQTWIERKTAGTDKHQ
jgi:SulP family sulfate permease